MHSHSFVKIPHLPCGFCLYLDLEDRPSDLKAGVHSGSPARSKSQLKSRALSHLRMLHEKAGTRCKILQTSQNCLCSIVIVLNCRLNTGYNIGVNNGKSAGQTIFHAHFHQISRRNGDSDNPRGGVRGMIPGKQAY